MVDSYAQLDQEPTTDLLAVTTDEPTESPSASPSTQPWPALTFKGDGLPAASYAKCEGDCDTDDDCMGDDLFCFHRDAYEPVPGCGGTLMYAMDYCVTKPPNYLSYIGDGLGQGAYGSCQGDCDTDDDCVGDDLVCMHRDGWEEVSGCVGYGYFGFDYCHRRPRSIQFFAIGDVPYSPMEACLLPHELRKLEPLSTSNEIDGGGRFLIHLGDIRDGKWDGACPESLYQNISSIFESSPVTTFFIPGDNGWLDCDDADAAHAFWKSYLFGYNERNLGWPGLGAAVVRDETHPEFFAFLMDGVLFLGQGLPGTGRDTDHAWNDWSAYMRANARWTEANFAANAANMRAAVIFGHASNSQNDPYFQELQAIASTYGIIPILFLEDGHYFATETLFLNRPNLYRIALDDTGKRFSAFLGCMSCEYDLHNCSTQPLYPRCSHSYIDEHKSRCIWDH